MLPGCVNGRNFPLFGVTTKFKKSSVKKNETKKRENVLKSEFQ